MQAQRGFTLIELITVLVIVGILVSMGIGYMSTGGAMAEQSYSQVHSLVSRAKAEASVQNVPVGCQLAANGAFCFVRADGKVAPAAYVLTSGLITRAAGDIADVVGQVRFDEALDIDATPPTGVVGEGAALSTQFYFLPDGMVVDAAELPFTSVYLVRKGNATTLVLKIYATGSIVDGI